MIAADIVVTVASKDISMWEYLATDQTVAVLWGLLVGFVVTWIALESGILDEGLLFGLAVCIVSAIAVLAVSYGAVHLLWKVGVLAAIGLLLLALAVFLAVVGFIILRPGSDDFDRRGSAMAYDPNATWDSDDCLKMLWLEEEARQQDADGFDGDGYMRKRAAGMGIAHLLPERQGYSNEQA